jgi:hypothetical protein
VAAAAVLALAVAVTFGLPLLVADEAGALPPPKGAKGGKAGKKNEALEKLAAEARDLTTQVDRQIMTLFSDQILAGVYRSRISLLQKSWQELLAGVAPKPVAPRWTKPLPTEFVINAVAVSDAETLEAALATPSCKKRAGCRIWASIGIGSELVRRAGKFEASADLKGTIGTTRYAVPGVEVAITGPLMTVDLPLSSLYIYKGTYTGTIKVLLGERFKSRPFSFQLIETY